VLFFFQISYSKIFSLFSLLKKKSVMEGAGSWATNRPQWMEVWGNCLGQLGTISQGTTEYPPCFRGLNHEILWHMEGEVMNLMERKIQIDKMQEKEHKGRGRE
jgi:hypothetical protein